MLIRTWPPPPSILEGQTIQLFISENGTSEIIRGHWDHKHYFTDPLLQNVTDFEINDVYLFATKKVWYSIILVYENSVLCLVNMQKSNSLN